MVENLSFSDNYIIWELYIKEKKHVPLYEAECWITNEIFILHTLAELGIKKKYNWAITLKMYNQLGDMTTNSMLIDNDLTRLWIEPTMQHSCW